MRSLRLIPLLLIALAVVSSPRPGLAHPHVWIDVRIEVVFDDQGRATGLRQEWLFDDYYTAFTVAGLGNDPDKLVELLNEIMGNLEDYDHFTKASHGEQPLGFAKVGETGAEVIDGRLKMRFMLPFAAPVTVGATPLVYAVFDPTYFIEIVHADASDAVRLIDAPDACAWNLAQPNPNPDTVALAAALDRTQTGGDGLGEYFAERVTIRCDLPR